MSRTQHKTTDGSDILGARRGLGAALVGGLEVGFDAVGGFVDPAFGGGVGEHGLELGVPLGIGNVAG